MQFSTDGQADLKVEGTDGTFFKPTNTDEQSDLEFLTLQCGNTEFTPVRQGNSYVYPNWNCEGFGYFNDLVLTKGRHYLKFTFGNQVAYAYNTAGDSEWTKRLGGTGGDSAYSITTDTNNNVIVTGSVTGIVDLNGDGDTSDANETPSGTYGGGDGLISVFNSSGTLVWSKRMGGTGTDWGQTITTDTDNNVIVVGIVNGSADLNGDGTIDALDANETPSGTYGNRDGFISVFNSSGTSVWSKRLGGTGTDYGYGITTDTNNRVIVTGIVTGAADLNGDGDTLDANENPTGTYGGIDAFISVFNSSGTFQWSKRLGGTGVDYGYGITTDTNNNVIVIANATGTADLNGDDDTVDANEVPTGTYGGIDAFISIFDSTGTFVWSKRLGGTGGDWGDSVTTDTNNNVIVTGQVTGTADLNGDDDTSDPNETPSGTYGGADAFISVFNYSGAFVWSERMGGMGADGVEGLTIDTNNKVIVSGQFNGIADLNGDDDILDANETPTATYSGQDAFISVFNSSGTFVWSERLGGTNSDFGNSIIADTNNNVIVDGSVNGTADLNGNGDTSDANETPSAIHGLNDIYISKLIVAPTVSSSAASSVTLTSAILNGSIDGTGVTTVTSRGFEWGTDTSYGTTVSESDSYGTGSFSTAISFLTCNTTYYFRAFATNSQGTNYSSDQSFTVICLSSIGSNNYMAGGTVVSGGFENSQVIPPEIPQVIPPEIPLFLQDNARNLSFGKVGNDVKALQKFLNDNGYPVNYPSRLGSTGLETTTFGFYTKFVLAKFQKDHGIKPAEGYLGPITRAYIKTNFFPAPAENPAAGAPVTGSNNIIHNATSSLFNGVLNFVKRLFNFK